MRCTTPDALSHAKPLGHVARTCGSHDITVVGQP